MNDNTVTVIAAPGVRVPKEGHARRYITDAEPVTEPDTAYYRRRIADGDLLLTAEAPPPSAPKKTRARKKKAATALPAQSPARDTGTPAPAETPQEAE